MRILIRGAVLTPVIRKNSVRQAEVGIPQLIQKSSEAVAAVVSPQTVALAERISDNVRTTSSASERAPAMSVAVGS